MSLEQLEAEALNLAPAEREILASRLIHSLDDAPLNDIDAAWIEEAERRYDELISGKAQGIPGKGFFDGIRREFGWK